MTRAICLSAEGAAFKSEMKMTGAKIDGGVNMIGASFDGDLNAPALDVGGDLAHEFRRPEQDQL